MKMRMIFCNCLQVGVDRWSDRYYTKDIALSSVVADFVRKHNEDFVGVELLDEGDESRREALDPDEEADRIEAEYEREREATCKESLLVGNASAMREALNMIKDEAVRLSKIYTAPMVHITSLVCDALSAHPRNCDVGTPEEQSARFDDHCRKHIGCLTCPLREKDGGVPKHCEFAWSQMPYEEDENGKESDVKE